MSNLIRLRQKEAAETFAKTLNLIARLNPKARERYPALYDRIAGSLWDSLRACMDQMSPLHLKRIIAQGEDELARREALRAVEAKCAR